MPARSPPPWRRGLRPGCRPSAAAERLERFGPNELVEKKQRPAWRLLLDQFTSAMIVVLLVAAVITALIGETKDTLIILAIVVFNGIVGFIQEYRAEQAMDALKRMSSPEARVVRDGEVRLGAGSRGRARRRRAARAGRHRDGRPAPPGGAGPARQRGAPDRRIGARGQGHRGPPGCVGRRAGRPAQHGLQRHGRDLRAGAGHRRGHRHGHRHRPHRRAAAAGRGGAHAAPAAPRGAGPLAGPGRAHRLRARLRQRRPARRGPRGDVPHRGQPGGGRHPGGPAGRRDHLAGPGRAAHGRSGGRWCGACRPWRRSAP